MAGPKILVVEDEPDLRDILVYHLKKEGFTVLAAGDGFEALQIVHRERPAVLLLDLMIPGLDGIQVCRRLKADQSGLGMSVIIVSARDAEEDVLRGLECGADDYVRKPFKLKEIVARIRTVLRRSRPAADDSGDEVLSFPPLTLNQASHDVRLDGTRLALTATEYRLLRFLMAHPERIFDRTQLLRQISDHKTDVTGRNIDVHIRSIRRKLGTHAMMIDTARGVGYRFLPFATTLDAVGSPVAATESIA